MLFRSVGTSIDMIGIWQLTSDRSGLGSHAFFYADVAIRWILSHGPDGLIHSEDGV